MERAVQQLQPLLEPLLAGQLNSRWEALRLTLPQSLRQYLDVDISKQPALVTALTAARQTLAEQGLSTHRFARAYRDDAWADCRNHLSRQHPLSRHTLRPKLTPLRSFADWLPRWRAYHAGTIGSALLVDHHWCQLLFAQMLSTLLFVLQDQLTALFATLHTPWWYHSALIFGVYRVLAWVIAVILLPMTIIFPCSLCCKISATCLVSPSTSTTISKKPAVNNPWAYIDTNHAAQAIAYKI